MAQRNTTPKIRFAGFSGDWEERKLGDYTRLITKGTTPKNKSGIGEINFVKVENISNGIIRPESRITNEEHNGYLQRSKLEDKDILFSIAGTLGRSAIVHESILPANTNQALAIIRDYDFDTDFLLTSLSGVAVSNYVRNNPTTGAQPNLSLAQVGDFDIWTPKINEQSKIGQLFATLDNLISQHQREHEQTANIKKAMLEKMFPKAGATAPEIRFAGFSGDWVRRKLADLCIEFRSGEFIKAADIAQTGAYPVYGGNGLRGYTKTYNHDGEYALIGRQGALCGNMKYVTGKAYFTEHAIAVRSNAQNNTTFLYQLLGTMNLGQYSGQSAQPGLAVRNLAELEPLVPTEKEQTKIGQFFASLDRLLSLQQRRLAKLKSIKLALLENMFV